MNIETVELKREDLPRLTFWVRRGYGAVTSHDLPRENPELWFDSVSNRNDRLDCMVYLYYTQVGLAGLTEIERETGTARLYLLLGETGYNSLRTGTYAALQMLDRAFGDLGLQSVETTVTTEDPDLQSMFPRLGFRETDTGLIITKAEFQKHRFIF